VHTVHRRALFLKRNQYPKRPPALILSMRA
jgi:hypothetical protein